MFRYVVLYKFTEQGRRNMRDTVHRAREISELNEAAGFRVIGTFWTQGQYDLVAIVESPNEDAMTTGLFSIAEHGNVVSETMRAFTSDEMQRAIGP